MPQPPRARFLLPLVLLAACSGPELRPTPPTPPPAATAAPHAAPVETALAAPLPIDAEGTLTPITARAQVPLTGPRVDAKPGDWLLENGDHIAVISAEGKLVDLGARGGRDELNYVDPTVFLASDGAHSEVLRFTPSGEGGRALHVERRVLEKALTLHSWFSWKGGILTIVSAVAANDSNATRLSITIGERVEWGNTPTWSEGFGFVAQGGTFIGDFLAREGFGVSYALCNPAGRMQGRHNPPDLAGFYEGARTGEERIPVPEGGLSRPRVITIAHGAGSSGQTAMTLPCVQRKGTQAIPLPATLPAITRIEVARCPDAGKRGTRYALFTAEDRSLNLPQGCFALRLFAPGHPSTDWFAPETIATKTLPASGTLRFQVLEKGKGGLPASVRVRGLKGTPDPDWGDDPRAGAALNVVSAEEGAGERALAPGRYKITIDRGFEYSAFEKEIVVEAGKVTTVRAEIERTVDTRGFLAADLHLHAMPSPDAPQDLEDRVRALVAAGIEVGVATDHNAVTDYAGTIKAMGLGAHLASVVGDEVTTKEVSWGHFNVFPLAPSTAPIPWKSTTPAKIFSAARASAPYGKDTIVQVNHPRMGDIGYFELMHLDRHDVRGFLARAPLADMHFDSVEVFNGDHYNHISSVEDCMRDWYALLNAGIRVTATGNSDSHKLTFHEAGVPRSLVMMPSDDPAAFDERAFVDAIRRGRVTVSSGPFVQLEANGKTLGASIAEGAAAITVRVDAPSWVDVDRVELIRRGEVMHTWKAPFSKGKHVFEQKVSEALRKGDWIIAVARGTKPMTHLHRSGALPFGFTNPIWVD